MTPPNDDSGTLSLDDVRKVARLSRLALPEEELAEQRSALTAVLGYVNKLRDLDTEGVEPLANPAEETNRLDADTPAPGLETAVLMGMAPASNEPFVTTPKVSGDGGGA